MVHPTSNHHTQAVMNNLKFIILGYLAVKNTGTSRHLTECNTLRDNALQMHTQHWSVDWNWCGSVLWALCSMWYTVPVCDEIIVSSIGRMLCAVVAIVIIQNVRWWLWADLRCVWKLLSLS